MSGPELICPRCNLRLPTGTEFCPNDHAITGGVRGMERVAIERTPNSKRHLLGVTVSDSYIINGYLGSGGFGAVYRAEQKALARDVALKLLMLDAVGDEIVVKRFKREARTAAALLDPNIVTLFDYGEATLGHADEDKVLWIAMELVHGPTLRQLCKRQKLSLDDALAMALNILRGLSAAHQLGVVHRDLKPGNVLIDESKNRPNFARLFDFGIASLQGSGGHTTQMGQGGVLGTPKYMAPEQWRAQQTAPCTDVYAFGVMLAEMLLGHPPIPKMELVDMAAAHCRDPRPNVTETATGERVPPALTNFIKKCMAIDPRQRYGTAKEALEAMQVIERDRERAPVPAVTQEQEPGTRDPDDPSRPSGSFTPPPTPTMPPPPPPEALGPSVITVPLVHDDDDIIELEVAEKAGRPVWPWVLGALAVALLIVGVQILTTKQVTQAQPADPVAVKTGAPDAAVVVPDAAVPDAAVPDAAVPDAAPPDAAVPDAAPPDAAQVAAANTPPKPKPVRKRPEKQVAKPKVEPKVEAPPPAPEPPAPKKIAGIDTTPKANLTAADKAKAQAQYQKGLDAEKRGAPKSAQRFFAGALRLGLTGSQARDAQRRIKRIADRTALEASEF